MRHRRNDKSISLRNLIAKEITSTPNDNVAVAVAGEDITVLIEGDTSDISGLISALEDAHTFVKHTAIVQGPKGHVSFPARNDLVSFQRMPLGANHRVDGTLQSTVIGYLMARFRCRQSRNIQKLQLFAALQTDIHRPQ